jgi:hypothetical protein
MATPFYGTLTIQNRDGTLQADRFDSTDVTNAYVTWKSAGGETMLTVLKDGYIKDVVLNITSAGDTKDFKLWLNQRDTNIRWVQSANFPTVDNRFTNIAPIPVSAGSKIQIEAIT